MDKIKRELVIESDDKTCEIALLENKKLVEYHIEKFSDSITIGDIVWGRVIKINPNLNAAFIDIGEEKNAFLHYSDMGENFPTVKSYFQTVNNKKKALSIEKFNFSPPMDKHGKIQDVLKKNEMIPVRIVKEPMSSKGARLSCEISLPGRYLVFIPFNQKVNTSKKIEDRAEKQRLKKSISSIKHKNTGVIVRTVANKKSLKNLHADYNKLWKKWTSICKKTTRATKVGYLYREQSRSNTLLRDIINDSFSSISVNNQELADSIRENLAEIAPDKVKIVRYTRSKPNLFESMGLLPSIKSSFNKIIPLPSGGYIIIEKTEAMFVIDVNSGKRSNKIKTTDRDQIIYKINDEAAQEIARQLRLRDIGGIIAVDFIDTRSKEITNKIHQNMKSYMSKDKASHTVLPLSRFCVMEITRSRTKPQVSINTQETCPSCNGTGKVTDSSLITDFIYNQLQSIDQKKIILQVHPYVYSYLKIGLIDKITKWKWNLKKKIKLEEKASFPINRYKIFDQNYKRLSMDNV